MHGEEADATFCGLGKAASHTTRRVSPLGDMLM